MLPGVTDSQRRMRRRDGARSGPRGPARGPFPADGWRSASARARVGGSMACRGTSPPFRRAALRRAAVRRAAVRRAVFAIPSVFLS